MVKIPCTSNNLDQIHEETWKDPTLKLLTGITFQIDELVSDCADSTGAPWLFELSVRPVHFNFGTAYQRFWSSHTFALCE